LQNFLIMSAKAIAQKVPAMGESISTVTLGKWLVKDGDFVKIDQALCEFESDKANLEFPAEIAGVIKILVKEGTDVNIGDEICTITPAEAPAETATPTSVKPAADVAKPAESKVAETTNKETYAKGLASPSAAKLIAEQHVDTSKISGTGKDGRITKYDVVSFLQHHPKATMSEAVQATQAIGTRNERVERMSKLRQTIAKRLVNVKNTTAMLTTFNEVDLTNVMAVRAKYGDKFKEKHSVGLGFMSFFTRAVCLALRDFPAVNAKIDGDSIVFHDYCDISIAVSTPRGLVVPVIRNAENMSLQAIEAKIKELAVKGRDGKLSMEEMQGGTFTITNGGVFGSLMSTPIINEPQVAILGMHKIQERPVAINGQVVIRPMMYLALSYDHRIIDGKESVSFLVRVKENLENPERLLLGKEPTEVLLDL